MIRRSRPNKLIAGANDIVDFGGAVASAAITVAAEIADVRQITIQLKDGQGNNLAYAAEVELALMVNAGATDFVVTGGSTGIAIGASGKLQQIIAKKRWKAISTAAGVIALTWTDTGTEAAYLAVNLPNGKRIISAALTNA